MSVDSILEKVKQLREITGVGFKDCKSAIDETKGEGNHHVTINGKTKILTDEQKRLSNCRFMC